MIIAGTGSCKRAMAVQVDVDPAWPVPGTNTWHCGHCTPAAELEAAFAWRLLWHIALALAEHTGFGAGMVPPCNQLQLMQGGPQCRNCPCVVGLWRNCGCAVLRLGCTCCCGAQAGAA